MKQEAFRELRSLVRHDANVRGRVKEMAQQRARSECQGKQRFANAQVARLALPKNDKNVSAYRCGSCGGWHVGRASTKARRLILKAKREAECV